MQQITANIKSRGVSSIVIGDCEYGLLRIIVSRRSITVQSAIGLYDIFAQIIFMQSSQDLCSMLLVKKLIMCLLWSYESELADLWKKFVHIGCNFLIKMHHSPVAQDQIAHAKRKIKRHVIFECVCGLITQSRRGFEDAESIIFFANELLEWSLEKNRNCEVLKIIKKALDDRRRQAASLSAIQPEPKYTSAKTAMPDFKKATA